MPHMYQLALISPRATEEEGESITISITFLLHFSLSLFTFLPSAQDMTSQIIKEPGLSLRIKECGAFQTHCMQNCQSKMQRIQVLESYRPLMVTKIWSFPRGSSSKTRAISFNKATANYSFNQSTDSQFLCKVLQYWSPVDLLMRKARLI